MAQVWQTPVGGEAVVEAVASMPVEDRAQMLVDAGMTEAGAWACAEANGPTMGACILTVLVPDEPDRTVVHDAIYQELVRGVVSDRSKANYLDIIDKLVARGAQGIIAGCTEIELLIAQSDMQVPLFPTAYLHAVAAVDFAVGDGTAQAATGPCE